MPSTIPRTTAPWRMATSIMSAGSVTASFVFVGGVMTNSAMLPLFNCYRKMQGRVRGGVS